MTSAPSVAIGLDLGTGGARAVAVDLDGQLVAQGRAELSSEAVQVEGARVEQDPLAWTAAANESLGQLMSRLPRDSRIVSVAQKGVYW